MRAIRDVWPLIKRSRSREIRRLSVEKRTMPAVQHEVSAPFAKATFGMGCFWASDALFGATPGVLRTRVGYSGGKMPNPVYRNLGDHTEVIEIDYDPKVVMYEDLLQLFWSNHEYGITTVVKRQYTSLILHHCDEQKRLAEIGLKREASTHDEKLSTEILPAGQFFLAEDYHQKYRLQQHPWIYEVLGLTAGLLQTSHVAARLNGYLAGVGSKEKLEEDLVLLGLPESVTDFVMKEWKKNEGGSLYC